VNVVDTYLTLYTVFDDLHVCDWCKNKNRQVFSYFLQPYIMGQSPSNVHLSLHRSLQSIARDLIINSQNSTINFPRNLWAKKWSDQLVNFFIMQPYSTSFRLMPTIALLHIITTIIVQWQWLYLSPSITASN